MEADEASEDSLTRSSDLSINKAELRKMAETPKIEKRRVGIGSWISDDYFPSEVRTEFPGCWNRYLDGWVLR